MSVNGDNMSKTDDVMRMSDAVVKDGVKKALERGFSVFPLKPNSKTPATPHAFKDAKSSPEVLNYAWEEKRENYGISTGKVSSLLVLDVDEGGDKKGLESLVALSKMHGKDFLYTYSVRTPRGGVHLYFRLPEDECYSNSNVRLKDAGFSALDIRCEGGYVVGPGSTINDTVYEVVDESRSVLTLPEWMKRYLQPKQEQEKRVTLECPDLFDNATGSNCRLLARGQAYIGKCDNVSEGERNAKAFGIAGQLFSLVENGNRLSEKEVFSLLSEWNSGNNPPLPEDELRRTVESSMSNGTPRATKEAHSAGPEAPQKAQSATARPKLTRMDTVETKPVEWLWDKRIALGKLSLLLGQPGVGKSTLTMELAARVSRGDVLPDSSVAAAGDVIILSAEDGVADTIAPRLKAANANMSRVFALSSKASEDGKEASVSLQDIDVLREAIRVANTPRLVIIDPVSAYLAGADSHSNTDVRGILGPLSTLAEDENVAILMVSHFNKSGGGVALYRAMGSLGFPAAARTVLGVAADKDDSELKYVLGMKSNLSAKAATLAYRINADWVVQWEQGTIDKDAEELFKQSENATGKLSSCVGRLRDLLGDGEWNQAREIEDILKEEGYSRSTIFRARKDIGVEIRRSGYQGASEWKLANNTAEVQPKAEEDFKRLDV